MIDREFSVRDYEQGFRDGKHEANAEIARLRAALEALLDDVDGHPVTLRVREQVRAALERK